MNSQTVKDITGFRSYLPDALRLRFDEQLSVRAIALQLGLSHSTIHNLFQRFNASGITWPLPESLSVAQLDINDNLLFNWKRLYEEGLLNDEDLQECQAVPVAITETPDPVKPVTNPFWRNKSDESQNDTTVDSPQCELHLKSGVVKLFAPLTPELLRVLIREMKGGIR